MRMNLAEPTVGNNPIPLRVSGHNAFFMCSSYFNTISSPCNDYIAFEILFSSDSMRLNIDGNVLIM